MKDIYLICPVRNATVEQKEKMTDYIKSLEERGFSVFYPERDNQYEYIDDIGYTICKENLKAIKEAKEVHIFWDKTSQGTLFDLGIAFALDKPLTIVNVGDIEITPYKSFANMIFKWGVDT